VLFLLFIIIRFVIVIYCFLSGFTSHGIWSKEDAQDAADAVPVSKVRGIPQLQVAQPVARSRPAMATTTSTTPSGPLSKKKTQKKKKKKKKTMTKTTTATTPKPVVAQQVVDDDDGEDFASSELGSQWDDSDVEDNPDDVLAFIGGGTRKSPRRGGRGVRQQGAPPQQAAPTPVNPLLQTKDFLWKAVDGVTTDAAADTAYTRKARLVWPASMVSRLGAKKTNLDYFLLMFPEKVFVRWEENLRADGIDADRADLYTVLAILFAMTLVKKGSRRAYWSKTPSKFY
jgi:hypothetical protein